MRTRLRGTSPTVLSRTHNNTTDIIIIVAEEGVVAAVSKNFCGEKRRGVRKQKLSLFKQ